MQQIIYFLRKYRFFLLFTILELFALLFTIQSHSFHKSKFVNSATSITGGVYAQVSNINDFFTLKQENKVLSEENNRLKNSLSKFREEDNNSAVFDSLSVQSKYNYTAAKIIKNEFRGINNFITINKGNSSGIHSDMGVINTKGIIGIVKNVSDKYATVLSILNSYSKLNVRLKNSNYFGTLTWNGIEYNTVQLIDIPRQANLAVGDTIITGGRSAIFPEGIMVGVIQDFQFEGTKFNEINIRLFNDMSALGYVQIIENTDRKEQQLLEEQTTNE
ncbi:MAG: rod shape-determining protein MreC [Flavobacteriaceae bacterium]|nr:MAG: rod shape-determining protein MreC [Flavobacteriaceae bacterium]